MPACREDCGRFREFLLSVLNVLSRTHSYAKKAVDLLRAHACEKSGGKPQNLPLDIPGGLLYNTEAVKKKTLQKDAEEPAPGLETIMAKDLHITFLLDFYGDMLTDKQRESSSAITTRTFPSRRSPR